MNITYYHLGHKTLGGYILYFKTIGKIPKVFTVGSECTKAFTYVGIEAHQYDYKIMKINQNSFTASIQPIEVTKERYWSKLQV